MTFLEELRASTSLANIAGMWVHWSKRKSNFEKGDYWASCPFHEEETASFHVDDSKGFYYCFGCHAKGDAVTFIREKMGLKYIDSVELLAKRAGLKMPDTKTRQANEQYPTLIELKEAIVSSADKENILEIGILTGSSDYINKHPRLLRSLSWGDPDYPGCILELLIHIEKSTKDGINLLKLYMLETLPHGHAGTSPALAAVDQEEVLGYRFEAPRNDCVAVMMPFSADFSKVYEAIKSSCADAGLECQRADEVWNSSILIRDILSLINHASVLICDLTGRNENVFYELGIAHAWGKKVIPITQRAEDVPFDLRHHRYLTYLRNAEGLAELRSSLAVRLKAMHE